MSNHNQPEIEMLKVDIHYFKKKEEDGRILFFTVLADPKTNLIVRSAWREPARDKGKPLNEVIEFYKNDGYTHKKL